ncbi:hypothetical protein [Tenacibaculum xiamenense]|uniref:hypothetical protein n=1 Tax=Tenacibaculum xiamenense TaxID=1261553 RepID=UPI0038B482A9
MKKLKNIQGFKTLNRQEQLEINGGIGRAYCKGSNQCCVRITPTFEFCDYGYCYGHRCEWA